MTVNQDRMLQTVVAGLNFRDAYERILHKLKALEGRCTAPDANLSLIQAELTSLYMESSIPFPTVVSDTVHLQNEYKHFQRNYHQNQNHKIAAERRRRAKGIPLREKPLPIQTFLDYTSPNYILSPIPPALNLPTPPSNDTSPSVTPDFQTIRPRSNIPPEPDYNEYPNEWFEWHKKYGQKNT